MPIITPCHLRLCQASELWSIQICLALWSLRSSPLVSMIVQDLETSGQFGLYMGKCINCQLFIPTNSLARSLHLDFLGSWLSMWISSSQSLLAHQSSKLKCRVCFMTFESVCHTKAVNPPLDTQRAQKAFRKIGGFFSMLWFLCSFRE